MMQSLGLPPVKLTYCHIPLDSALKKKKAGTGQSSLREGKTASRVRKYSPHSEEHWFILPHADLPADDGGMIVTHEHGT